jgi:hypothetical protein
VLYLESMGGEEAVLEELEVGCYSGHTYAERPQSFVWRGEPYEITKVEKAWQEPGRRCFQVSTGDNKLFQLCYNEVQRQWSLVELLGGRNVKGNP